MRLYSVTNCYIKPIQAGIQTAHGVHEIYEKYKIQSNGCAYKLSTWARDHKTIIVLDGGNQAKLQESLKLFEDISILQLPFASFNENKDSLNGAMTAVVIVVPEDIYNFPKGRLVEHIHSEYTTRLYDGVCPVKNRELYNIEMCKLRLYFHLKSKRLA